MKLQDEVYIDGDKNAIAETEELNRPLTDEPDNDRILIDELVAELISLLK